MAKSEVSIREYDRERDMEAIEKLERSCEIGAGKGFSIVTNMMGDPLCRIRLFQLHVMMVAELTGGGGELVGVARGCVKRVATGVVDGDTVLAGYVLGLRVSPVHRRKGIGLKLVESVEAWAARHGARHVVAAADAANAASRGLFVGRRGYATAARLSILVQPLADVRPPPAAASSRSDVRIERLAVEQAAMLYKRRFGGEPLCPSDVDAVLGAAPSLGTWMARFAGGGGGDGGDGAWACVSLWNTCASYRLQVVAPPPRPAGGGRALLARLAAVAPTPPWCLAAIYQAREFKFLSNLPWIPCNLLVFSEFTTILIQISLNSNSLCVHLLWLGSTEVIGLWPDFDAPIVWLIGLSME
uniref:Acetyltransferase, GNAT family protein n=1 Tax=Oryza sativa subsp. japonica TaxID=39947 RepID=Q2QNL1_ORYSJ|nr:acetyltransferase, GNAT family protein [Oryza sativa Japonica Group]